MGEEVILFYKLEDKTGSFLFCLFFDVTCSSVFSQESQECLSFYSHFFSYIFI